MTPDEITKLSSYLQKTFQNKNLKVIKRPKKDDSAEVYLGDEFIGVIFKDNEDPDDISYDFSMAILDVDLD